MPNDKLEWSIPIRKRTMREFTHHIFSHHILDLIREKNSNTDKSPEAGFSNYMSFQNIADYGRTVLDMFRSWSSQQDLNSLNIQKHVSFGGQTIAEILDLVAGQIVQHLRQLYSILEGFGITPKDRVKDEEWPPEYVLSILW